MANAAGPWHPRLCPPGAPLRVGFAQVKMDDGIFEENITYYRFINSEGKLITVQVKHLDAKGIFSKKIKIPEREGIEFATKGTDIALYPQDHKEYIDSITGPIVQRWLESLQKKPKPDLLHLANQAHMQHFYGM